MSVWLYGSKRLTILLLDHFGEVLMISDVFHSLLIEFASHWWQIPLFKMLTDESKSNRKQLIMMG